MPLDPIIGCCLSCNLLIFKWAFFGTFFAQSKKVQKEKLLNLKAKEKKKRKKKQKLNSLFLEISENICYNVSLMVFERGGSLDLNIMLIVNPMAGRGRWRGEIAYILDTLCKEGPSVSVYVTRHSKHATQLAKKHGANYDIVACMGGDGTLAETVAGLMTISPEKRPPVGYIPMGTSNDMANTLGIPKDASLAASLMIHGTKTPVDVGRVEEDYFSYIAAFGAFTEVAYETPTENKQNFGHLAYVLEGMARLGKIKPSHLTVEYTAGGKIQGDFIFGAVCNTTSIAGFLKLKPDLVDLGDGAFEVILIKNPQNILALNQIFLDLMMQKHDTEHIQIFRAKDVRFRFDTPTAWTRDGECGGVHKDVSLHVLRPGVEIFVPNKTSGSHFPRGFLEL